MNPTEISTPKRIQLRRTKGWRKPPDAIVVSRPSVYGNPWTLRDVWGYRELGATSSKAERERAGRTWVVEQYRRELLERQGTGELEFVTIAQIRERLCGRDLACWCPLDQPCHADVLLEVANTDQPARVAV